MKNQLVDVADKNSSEKHWAYIVLDSFLMINSLIATYDGPYLVCFSLT
jgi:hypothetical protein